MFGIDLPIPRVGVAPLRLLLAVRRIGVRFWGSGSEFGNSSPESRSPVPRHPNPESRTPNPDQPGTRHNYGTNSDLGSILTIQSPLYMSFTYARPSFTTTPHVMAVFFT